MWPVEILADGEFEVEMHYACTAASVGTEVKLCLGDACASAVITEPNDPPAVGAENDRVTRTTQSFVKDFKPLSLGRVQFGKQRGDLKLTASNATGKMNLEMRLLMIRRIR